MEWSVCDGWKRGELRLVDLPWLVADAHSAPRATQEVSTTPTWEFLCPSVSIIRYLLKQCCCRLSRTMDWRRPLRIGECTVLTEPVFFTNRPLRCFFDRWRIDFGHRAVHLTAEASKKIIKVSGASQRRVRVGEIGRASCRERVS